MQLSMAARVTIGFGGAVGALWVMAAAAASHNEESRNFSAIAAICLSHGPLLVALGLYGLRSRWFGAAALVIGIGTLLFAGDLLALQFLGHSPLPVAAPIGGAGMIVGWVLLIGAAAFAKAA